jgi:uncharacterized protein (DUF305 family)
MKRFIITVAAVLMAGSAHAQQPTPEKDMPGKDMGPAMEMEIDKKMVVPNATDTPSTAAYQAAMTKAMMTIPKFTGDADLDFMTQMRPHHQAAIDMAKILLANGKDSEAKTLAQEIIAAQQKEIAVIDAWLKKKGS